VALVHVLFAPLGNSLRVGSRSSWVSADEAGRVGCRLLPLELLIHSFTWASVLAVSSVLDHGLQISFSFFFCSAANAIPGARSLRLS
jgi:hypothetical protein